MRDITHCPNCQTQFFVSEDQLKQHGGLVRCGQCLHVFNAKEQFVMHAADTQTELKLPNTDQPANIQPATIQSSSIQSDSNQADTGSQNHSQTEATQFIPASDSADSTAALTQPSTIQESVTLAKPSAIEADPATQSSWPPLEQIADLTPAADTSQPASQPVPPVAEQASSIALNGNSTSQAGTESQAYTEYSTTATPGNTAPQAAYEISPNMMASSQSHYVNDPAAHAKLDGRKSIQRYRWLWAIAVVLLLGLAMAQSTYFLRNTIAMYYPGLKPYLIQACQPLQCSIELPKQIEWIIIDDSDMQEDPDHAGVMRLSSMLYNKAGFVQAYPNLELTLTDTDDNAVLRRVFKPAEYLPADTDIANGFKAGGEIKVKLAITAQQVSVAGYRLFVTY